MKKQKKLFNLYPLYYDTLKIYLKQIDKIKNDDLNKLLYEFLENLNKITHFMIQGRFTPKNKNNSSISSNLKKSPAMVKYLDEGRKKIITPAVNLLDIIKFYKMLENFTLKRQYLESSLENFEFGKFSEHSSLIYLNLPTLLLSVDKLDASSRKLYLNIIFSAISIYRLFKVKSLPNSDTITKPYSGDDLIKHSHNNFSATKIGV